MPAKLLLLEARHENPEHHRSVEFFPYLLGLLTSRGCDAAWWVTPVAKRSVRQGQRYELHLSPEESPGLFEAIAAWQPERIVTNDPPSPALRQALIDAAPGASVVHLSGRITFYDSVSEALALLDGADVPALDTDDDTRLVLAARPVFERRFFGGGFGSASEQFHRLATRVGCSYRRPAAENRFFAHLDSDAVRSFRGCTFCNIPLLVDRVGRPPLPTEQAIELTLDQIRAHQTAAPPSVTRFIYLVDQGYVGERITRLLARLLEEDLRPTTLITMLRPDVLLAKGPQLAELLSAMEARDHRLRLVSTGVENLSDEENERFNKGVVAEQVLACVDMLEDLRSRFPRTLDLAPLSGILFTPWTRLDDLRANARAARKLGARWLSTMISTALQLWEGTATTELARHDGLVAERFGSVGDVAVSNVTWESDLEIPWRFADPRIELAHRILIRLDPMCGRALFGQDDPLLARIRRARQRVPPSLSDDYIAMVEAVLDAIEALGAEAEVEQVFARIAAS